MSDAYILTLEVDPKREDQDIVMDGLHAFNAQQGAVDDYQPLLITLRLRSS